MKGLKLRVELVAKLNCVSFEKLTNISDVVIIAVDVQAVRHEEHIAPPFSHDISSLAIEHNYRVVLYWSKISLLKDVGRDVEGLRVPDALRSVKDHDILVDVKCHR